MDAVTGLADLVLLSARFDFAMRLAKRAHDGIALMRIDLTRSSDSNAAQEKSAGEAIVVESAKRLLRATRATDTVARLEGDQFVVLLPGATGENHIANLADNLMHALAHAHNVDGHAITVSPSIGIALWPTDGEDLATLTKHADAALLHAKSNGPSGYSFFRREINERVNDRLWLEDGLRHAIDRHELTLEYQPILSLPSRQIISVEAQLCWQSDTLGIVPPSRFVPVADESGLIHPIGEWVVKQACIQLARWRALGMGHFPIAVRVSAAQWRSPVLLASLQTELAANGLTPSDIELELTEAALEGEVEGIVALLARFSEAGFRLVIDDFGTKHAHLAYLKRSLITKLKIDHSFMRDIATDMDAAAIVRGIISLAHSLGLRAAADGVVYQAQLECLLAAGCTEAQGDLLAKPMSAVQFQERF